MAFYPGDDEEQQDPNQQQGGVQTSAGSGIITGSGGSSSNVPQGASNSPDNSGGNFVGIKQYLDANKPQASKLGDQASGVINTSADQARQGLQSLNTEADSKIKSVNSLDSGISGKLQNGAESLSDDEKNIVKQTSKAQYTGPKNETELGDVYNNAAKATKTATQNIDNSGTEQGRMNLISQINSKPRTQGMNVFDNTLLQAGGGREKLAQASMANQDVKGGLDAATEAIRGKIGRADDPSTPDIDESAGAIGQTNKAQKDAYDQVQAALNNWQSGFQPRVQQAQSDVVGQNNRVTQDFANDPLGLSDETLGLYGLSEGQDTYGADLGGLFQQGDANTFTPESVATAQDYARYSALADLAGVDPTVLNPANASKAGTGKGASVDKNAVMQAIAGKKSEYDQELAPVQQKHNETVAWANNPSRQDVLTAMSNGQFGWDADENAIRNAIINARQASVAASQKDIDAVNSKYDKKVRKG